MGKIIEFSGVFGAGKSTQVAKLKKFLTNRGYRVITFTERSIKFDNDFFNYNRGVLERLNQKLALFKKSRADYLLLDRGYFDLKIWLEIREKLGHITHSQKKELLKKLPVAKAVPAKLIYMMTDIKTAIQRRKKDTAPIDKYTITPKFALIVHQIFLQKVKELPKNALVINASLSISDAFSKIKKYLFL